MKKRSYVVLLVLFNVIALSFGIALADGATWNFDSVKLKDSSTQAFSMMACQKDGISWWDKCSAKFYFDKEHDGSASEEELVALHTTLPTCTATKVKNGALLKEVRFSMYQVREMNWSDSWCWMTYGMKFKVVIPTANGDQTFIIYDFDD